MKKIEPYTDKRLVFNQDTERYELSIEWIKQNYTNPFRDDNVLAMRLKKNTRKVYNYIFSISYSANAKTISAIINKTEEYRKWIGDCLEAQMEADLASGYNDQSLYPSRNADDRSLKYIDEVCVDCERVIYNCTGYGGINIVSQTPFPYTVYLEFMER